MYKAKSGPKPTFRWVPAPDGQTKSALGLFDHCMSIQSFYRMVERMDSQQVLAAYADEVEVLRELMTENGIKVAGPQWFARLLNQ